MYIKYIYTIKLEEKGNELGFIFLILYDNHFFKRYNNHC